MRSSGPLSDLDAAAGALDEDDLDAAGDAELAAQIRGLWAVVCRLHAQLSRRIAVFDERGAAARDGARSTRDWLRHRLRVDGVEAARQSAVAAALADRPVTAAAYRRGEISPDHVAAVSEAAWLLGRSAMTREVERLLLEHARREPPGRVRRVARRLRARADPRAAVRAFRQARQDRRFDAVRTRTGALAISGQLDPADAELLLAAIAAQRPGADTGVFRTPAQRHADALAAVCRAALRADLRHAGDRPRVVVTVPLHALRGGSGAAGSGAAGSGGALLGSGEPVPAETARRLACDARIVPAVLGGPGAALDIGVETETVSQGLRRAVELRDGGCRFPGCDRPPADCEAHHVRHWALGGTSTADNVVLLCPHHHGLTHEGGWRVALDPYTGEVRARRPDGTRLDAVDPPADRPPPVLPP